MGDKLEKKRRPLLRWAAFLLVCVGAFFGGRQILFHPKSPLPPEWNPTIPFNLGHPETPLSSWKLGAALKSAEACVTALETGASFVRMTDLRVSELCHIQPRVRLASVGETRLSPVETRCQTALRLAAWLRHGVEPAATDILGGRVVGLTHASSYNCRQIRTPGGEGGRMSTHATASAIDVTGFVLSDGRRLSLINGWNAPETAEFFRQSRDEACTWFGTVLGPEFNRLHADHFHLQNRGWGTCR